jgi:hypothetical protein
MATIEREHEQRIRYELPVFVANDGRRARRLRLVAAGIGVLALLWLVALAAGMLGFGRLPGISTPVGRLGGPDKAQSQRSESKTETPVRSSQRPAELIVASERNGRATPSTQPDRARPTVRGTTAKPVARRAPPPAAAQPVQPQPAQPPPQQGWARHGRPVPPGYTRRTQPEPAPPPPGQASAPGQTKKALQPPPLPPPPPPPPGNGGGSKKP